MTPARRRLAVLGAAVALGGGAIAVALDGSDPAAPRPVPEGNPGLAQPETPPAPKTPKDDRREARADADLPVPLARAAARVFLVGFPATGPGAASFARLDRREWGAMLVDRTNVADAAALRTLTREIAGVARARRRQPPLVAAAQLGGEEVTLDGVGPRRQGAITDPPAARRDARDAGRALRRAGVRVVLAPSADLRSAAGPWATRGFTDDPQAAARLVAGAVDGWSAARVAPVVGHFPGEGAASQDPEAGAATVGLSQEELRARDGVPFAAVLRSAPAIQISGALYAGFDGVTPATLDPAVVAELRRRGFRGAVVSANLTAVTLVTGGGVGAAAVAALKAGCDVLVVPGDLRNQEEAYSAVVAAVRSGAVPAARLREALERGAALRRATG